MWSVTAGKEGGTGKLEFRRQFLVFRKCSRAILSSHTVFCLNSIYSIITFGKLIKTLVWPGPGLLVSVNRDAGGDMMIENAPGYLDVYVRDINTDERRDTEVCLHLSALWPLTPPILGEPGHFLATLATPTTFPHRESPGPVSDAPLYSRASWHAPHGHTASHDELTSPEKYCSTATRGPWPARDVPGS